MSNNVNDSNSDAARQHTGNNEPNLIANGFRASSFVGGGFTASGFQLVTQPSDGLPPRDSDHDSNLGALVSATENSEGVNTDFKLASPEQHTVFLSDGTTEQIFVLTKDLYLIGRDVSCDMRLHSGFVSRCHAHLRFRLHDDGHTGYEIIDGDLHGRPSKNGLILDGSTSVKRHNLRHGDIITFAPEAHLLYLSPTSYNETTMLQP
jgi:hypothetical protein